MTRDEIERTYGEAIRTERETSYFPFGTRYSGKSLERSEYAVRKGTLRVWYVEGHAKVLETTSPRYRTPGGIRVGLHVRGASCPGSGQAVCVNGFQYDDCTGFLIPASAEGSLDVHLELAGRGYHPRVLKLRGDRLRRIVFGDDDVLLTCF